MLLHGSGGTDPSIRKGTRPPSRPLCLPAELLVAAIIPWAGDAVFQSIMPSLRPTRSKVCWITAAEIVPSFVASEASIVAIFAGRTTEGAGRPARESAVIATSPGQPRFSALVIMTTHMSP
jgi:hypothetical protein